MCPRTLYQKIWDQHVVTDYGNDEALLYVDRHLVQEVSSPQAFATIEKQGRKVRRPEAHVAVADHAVPTKRDGRRFADELAQAQVDRLKQNAKRHDITYLPMEGDRHGIVHVIGPELGFTLPGSVLVCGDSHTSTHGAFGCIAFGIGASECATVFAAQSLRQRRQKTMRVNLEGGLPAGVTVKDVILALIAKIGTGGGVGYAIEYAGSTVRDLSMESRMTLCNMSIEAGSRVGMVAPDEKTIAYLKDRPLAPKAELWDAAVTSWMSLRSDEDAVFDREITFDTSTLEPQVSWGTTPEHTLPVNGVVPDPETLQDDGKREKMRKTLEYMGLTPGTRLSDVAIDTVFIGSCTNGRIEDLRAAAKVLTDRKVSPGIRAIAVPGSASVKAIAEAEGLDRVFLAAGFEWRDAGCSMCVGMNDDRLSKGERSASTSNRNFEGRQGIGGRTHLMSPQMAAAAAIAGHITDVRDYL
ncbi:MULTISPECIES: 3-isopropylmalate dehydratase large subunit [Maritimibacter]|uniref:3-isopropylmalate dehydratase large subunit n=1 Tax=Maritimibacter alkaliphilus HTCC2654 TaxID=314271 RepID=A3VGB1_9RHOB|nr:MULTISPECIES: 3-isopropylmalate dehydratase large subunit [Maritimibacter]EAQ12887.1 isopropylmalate isomerase large subunit [Rhodobacterales bacterium HTCC2654] [Maritimibacter alkaliphilus HTCC2654]TYP85720.1 3-isopropylmalate/(R)-2-methylmalate dehydratase large subunit [Maritimibacter alkaliphilus HTCC2654]